ncbi:hypothetical protein [Aidingimonas halophila]|uniref:Uncharacterized protein n=1 Tax=Aidingimonas halophila TaxID=574349 RepID=A0A1H2ZZ57_9GAMM|nr:hypothetical protein [Aidingimonas halophila]GHC21176.1 hypothetical protein GCM10008094_09760 [Aidingimonas halophila]SDX22471.1 hypothetical protein SAMN05443545_104300 [Aidingimonas halophila]
MNHSVLGFTEEGLTRSLSYSGFVLLAFELVKSLIVEPIKLFYRDTTFHSGPFKSYEHDVRSRHKNEFEACLLYLRDFMNAIDSDDMASIQALRKHRNELAHNLPKHLHSLDIASHRELLERVDRALFKLSNYRTYMEIGNDPEFRGLGIDWGTVYGTEYMIFKEVIEKVRVIQEQEP